MRGAGRGVVSGKSFPLGKSKPPSIFFFLASVFFLQNRDDNTLPQKVGRNKSIVSGSALQMTVCSIIRNTTVGETQPELRSELANLAGRRVRGNQPEPGRGDELRPRL